MRSELTITDPENRRNEQAQREPKSARTEPNARVDEERDEPREQHDRDDETIGLELERQTTREREASDRDEEDHEHGDRDQRVPFEEAVARLSGSPGDADASATGALIYAGMRKRVAGSTRMSAASCTGRRFSRRKSQPDHQTHDEPTKMKIGITFGRPARSFAFRGDSITCKTTRSRTGMLLTRCCRWMN